MVGMIVNEGIFVVGKELVFDGTSPTTSFAAVFEDDGETGYFYALNRESQDSILDALHIYNVSNVTDGQIPSSIQIIWSNDGLKTALRINDFVHAVFDFQSKRGYCRTG